MTPSVSRLATAEAQRMLSFGYGQHRALIQHAAAGTAAVFDLPQKATALPREVRASGLPVVLVLNDLGPRDGGPDAFRAATEAIAWCNCLAIDHAGDAIGGTAALPWQLGAGDQVVLVHTTAARRDGWLAAVRRSSNQAARRGWVFDGTRQLPIAAALAARQAVAAPTAKPTSGFNRFRFLMRLKGTADRPRRHHAMFHFQCGTFDFAAHMAAQVDRALGIDTPGTHR